MELFSDAGFDLLQTLGRNRDMAAAEETVVVYASTSLHPYVDEIDVLTLRVSNNTQPSAQVVVDVYFALGA